MNCRGRDIAGGMLLCAAAVHAAAQDAETTISHASSLIGDIRHGAGFEHFDYVNPNAPRGGTLRLAYTGGFDSFNPFIVTGNPVLLLDEFAHLVYESLFVRTDGESTSVYALIAESIEYPDDYSWAKFVLRDTARWHDGRPITPEDVIFSMNLLREQGAPQYAAYYRNVERVEKIDESTVLFVFDEAGNRELPHIVAELVVFPKHFWEGVDADGNPRDFSRSSLEPPLGSGPYQVGRIDAGRYFELERVDDYWGADLPVNVGHYNFDTLRMDYYQVDEVALTAFLAGEYDLRYELSSKSWATAYDTPAVAAGEIVRAVEPTDDGEGMQGFFINTRRSRFADARVREALGLAFDFEWTNRNIFYDLYIRTDSYYENSELASSGIPSGAELAMLEPYRDRLPPELFTEPFRVPTTDGLGNNRANLARAIELLSDAGWSVSDGQMTHGETGEQLELEVLLVQPAFERVVQPYLRNLEILGISASIRIVEAAQYLNLRSEYDFDLIVSSVGQSLSPGNEQRDFWGSDAADIPGGRNYAGIKDPVVDALIEKVIFAPDRAALITATQALDRVLLWGHYVVPHYHPRGDSLAWWDRFGRPEVTARHVSGFSRVYSIARTWWFDEQSSGGSN